MDDELKMLEVQAEEPPIAVPEDDADMPSQDPRPLGGDDDGER